MLIKRYEPLFFKVAHFRKKILINVFIRYEYRLFIVPTETYINIFFTKIDLYHFHKQQLIYIF